MENNSSIFMSQNDATDNDIAGKITYTNIINTIPEDKSEKQLPDWKKKYNTEWRWRFLKLTTSYENKKENIKQERHVVEISYQKNNSNKRIYFNRHGQWVEREVDPIFDNFVKKEYYVYTNN